MEIQRRIKRLLDVLLSLLILVFLAPAWLVFALAIVLESRGGVLFTQPRVGQGGQIFKIYKFRSMRPNKIDYCHLKEVGPDNPLVTRIGRVIRRYGIDELPQLVNILRGEMSFVGPRPTIQEQVDRYAPYQRRRLAVRPGLTGLAQVSGNTTLTWTDRIILDVWYIDHWSLRVDFLIVFHTIAVILKGQVAGQPVRKVRLLPSLDEASGYVQQNEQKTWKAEGDPL